MIPELEKKMNDEVRKASLEELMPGFDKEAEWQKLSKHLTPARKTISLRTWAYAAAMLVLVGVATWFTLDNGKRLEIAGAKKIETPIAPAGAVSSVEKIQTVAVPAEQVVPNKLVHNTIRKAKTKEVIHNSTPCPIEICISQTMKCPNAQPSSISTYSTLQPSQSVELHYKDDGNIEKNCSVVVKAIEFKSVATGETILLNSNSSITAEEVFSYMTGRKKGDVLAGAFSLDCNNRSKKHNLKLDNSYGKIILQ